MMLPRRGLDRLELPRSRLSRNRPGERTAWTHGKFSDKLLVALDVVPWASIADVGLIWNPPKPNGHRASDAATSVDRARPARRSIARVARKHSRISKPSGSGSGMIRVNRNQRSARRQQRNHTMNFTDRLGDRCLDVLQLRGLQRVIAESFRPMNTMSKPARHLPHQMRQNRLS